MSRQRPRLFRMEGLLPALEPPPPRDVRVRLGAPVPEVGQCNGCTERTATTVTEVHLRGLQFRVCNTCRDTMLRGMLEAYK